MSDFERGAACPQCEHPVDKDETDAIDGLEYTCPNCDASCIVVLNTESDELFLELSWQAENRKRKETID